MFSNKIVKCRSTKIFDDVNRIKLIDADVLKLSWDDYFIQAKANDEHSGAHDFEELTRKKYHNYINAKLEWKFRFTKVDVIELINWGEDKLILSSNWSGEIKFQDDIVIELFEEKSFPLYRHIKYFANLYVKVQMYVEHGGPDNVMSGAKPGIHERWLSKGSKEEVTYDKNNKQLRIGKALFQVI